MMEPTERPLSETKSFPTDEGGKGVMVLLKQGMQQVTEDVLHVSNPKISTTGFLKCS